MSQQAARVWKDGDLQRRMDTCNDPVILTTEDGRIGTANSHASNLLKYSVEELCRLPALELFVPEERDRIVDRVRRHSAGEVLFPSFSTYILDKAGDPLHVQIIGFPETWEGKPAFLNFIRDLTTEEELARDLQSAQRLQSLGTLAGGIAHDFNNLLMAIQGTVSLVLMDMDRRHPHYEDLISIEDHVRSGAELTRQLLGYARQGKFEVKLLDLGRIVEETSMTYGRTRKDIGVAVQFEGARDCWAMVDAGAIEQVLLNLLVNAGDAMPNGGNIVVALERVQESLVPVPQGESASGDYVRLHVSDDGPGMDPVVAEHAFEPFFTTKEVGKGTGLGLASVYGIVKRHGGFLRMETNPDKGTAFDIFFPAASPGTGEEMADKRVVRKRSATILFVDDEDAILKLGERLLDRIGYTVLSATSGEEAVGIYERIGDQIDLVILDMVMPHMGGEETYRKLRALDEDVNILISSGYSLEYRTADILKHRNTGFVQKPYNIQALSTCIDEMLLTPEEGTPATPPSSP